MIRHLLPVLIVVGAMGCGDGVSEADHMKKLLNDLATNTNGKITMTATYGTWGNRFEFQFEDVENNPKGFVE